MKKKILLTAAVIGLIAVPSIVLAQNGADDAQPNNVRQEDRREDRRDDTAQVQSDNTITQTPEGIPVQQEVDVPDGSISLDQAQIAALNASGGKTLEKIEIEEEEGVVVYSFRFTDGSRVDVRASDGEIVRTEGINTPDQNNDDDDHDDDDDEDDDDDHHNRGRGRGHDKDGDGEDDHKHRRGRGHHRD